MKTIKNIYKTLTREKVREIILKATKHKTHRKEVIEVLDNLELYTDNIYYMLQHKTYYLKKTRKRTFIEKKGKERELTISPFYPNRILDYIITETLKPYIKKSMYPLCIGNVDKRGIVYGMKIIRRKYKKYKYFVKLDIKKFYPSTSSTKLMEFIKTKVKDRDFIELCETIVLSQPDMPIGDYYSQWFSNWFLQDLDYNVKQKQKIEFYARYVDDMLLMSNNKRKLLCAMYNISKILSAKGLCLKRIEQISQVSFRPIDFLGFRFTKTNVKLRLRIFKTLNKKIKSIRKSHHICVSIAQSLMSYLGWLKQLRDGFKYYLNRIKETITFTKLSSIISNRSTTLCLNN